MYPLIRKINVSGVLIKDHRKSYHLECHQLTEIAGVFLGKSQGLLSIKLFKLRTGNLTKKKEMEYQIR